MPFHEPFHKVYFLNKTLAHEIDFDNFGLDHLFLWFLKFADVVLPQALLLDGGFWTCENVTHSEEFLLPDLILEDVEPSLS